MLDELSNICFYYKVEHEEWWFAFKSFQNQFRDQLHAWLRDRNDLLFKIKAVFAEANAMNEAARERSADRQRQEKICKEWHEKVQASFSLFCSSLFFSKSIKILFS